MFFNNPEAFEKLAEETGLTEKIAHFSMQLNQIDKHALDLNPMHWFGGGAKKAPAPAPAPPSSSPNLVQAGTQAINKMKTPAPPKAPNTDKPLPSDQYE
jgi:hypothetical protein